MNTTRVEVAIVGAGFAGLGMAMALRRAGREDFVVLERGGLGRRHLARQHLPGRRVRRALAPLRLRRRTRTRTGRACTRAATRSARTSSASPTRRSSASGCGCARRCCRRDWDADGGGLAHRHRRRRIGTGGDRRDVIVADALVLACGRLTEPDDPRDRRARDLPRAAVPLGALGSRRRPRRRPRRRRRHGRERGAARARTRATRRARHALPAHAGVDRAARRRRVLRRRARAVRRATRELLDALRADLYAEGEARFASRSGDAAAAADARAVALAHLRRAGRRPGAARRAHARLRVRLQARAALGRLLPRRRRRTRVTLVRGALVRVDGSTLVAATARATRSTRSCSRPASPRRASPTPSSCAGEGGVTLDEHWSQGMTLVRLDRGLRLPEHVRAQRPERLARPQLRRCS